MRCPWPRLASVTGGCVLAVLPLVAACGGGGGSADSTAGSDDSTSVRIGTSSSSSTIPADECPDVLELGCEGADVEVLQRLLRSRVDGEVDVTGDFDEETDRALREFEDRRCDVCVADGRIEIDGAEWKELVGLRSTTTVRPRELSA